MAEITRRAAAPRSALLQIVPDQAERAAELLRSVPGVQRVEIQDDRPGLLVVTFDGSGELPVERGAGRAHGSRPADRLVRAGESTAERRIPRDDGSRMSALQESRRAWPAVVEQELRDLWIGGRGLALSVAFGVLMSVVAYLVATNRGLNFLEHRETVNLTLQVAVGGRCVADAARRGRRGQRRARARDPGEPAPEPRVATRAHRRQAAGGAVVVGSRLRDHAAVRLVPGAGCGDRRRFGGHGSGGGDAARALPRVARRPDQRLLRLQPRQPLGQPVRTARVVRADATPVGRAEGLARRGVAATRPDHRRRALRREDRRRRPRLERGRLAGFCPRRSPRSCSPPPRSQPGSRLRLAGGVGR